ncbi:MAG: Alanine racemase [Candidatus Moranbacteria bacterium GW2011_GWC2_37_8]|nr:MAG: Alanine racemase [Candidatus Moranbacteria bacterium GW2011_GWC2_37_8]KKQ63069.1 MAG: Alanine racemase [Parcubacteria group bacterium GW2011_GWC1_38_22]KKQ79722.1 MAG: Alanine racemase [Candidatus Moranbacteria bacterium GW2011_GWD2_38_7]
MKSLVKPGVKIAAVIKANAYGHGQNEVVQILEDDADYFQVDDARELELLRQVSQKPTLVLGFVSKEEMPSVIGNEGIFSVYDEGQIFSLNEISAGLNKKVSVHLKIDACLGRQGVLIENVQKIIDVLADCSNIVVDGIYSHFANIEDTSDFSHAQKQIDSFTQAVKIFEKNGYSDLQTHISASSGIMVYENAQGKSSIVRAGLGIYGMWPSEELKERFESESFKLKPVMRWVTHVAQIKTLPENYSIGYGLTYITSKQTKIAVIPQGYSDGYDRGLSNIGEVLINGSRCKVLGRIAMNMFVVDVSHLDKIALEDEVVLLGKQEDEEITAEEIAAHIGSINYEITTRVFAMLPRVIK